ncbi:hypothetical protein GPL17_36800 [Bradyrhizobium yuanmingense]|uniref:hypothetical protein n=1 Tax=Bradyrhizobium yuanmingense TaxID=108015 RepID=UPI0012F82DA7|nr:hypothetical protein [Bradyrhizobium yuanmingense]MVT55941.1 hypothetical protein [Bradyrhizobium yuanmingense]
MRFFGSQIGIVCVVKCDLVRHQEEVREKAIQGMKRGLRLQSLLKIFKDLKKTYRTIAILNLPLFTKLGRPEAGRGLSGR